MIILKPEPIVDIVAPQPGVENLLTPSAKEVFVGSNGPASIVFDLGSEKAVDTILVGFTNLQAPEYCDILAVTSIVGDSPTLIAHEVAPAADSLGTGHVLMMIEEPVVSRFFAVNYFPGGENFVAGILIAGKCFRAPHERGGGRQLIDTGTKELLPDGGVGGEDGVILSSLKWRFTGLSDAMRRQLWALAFDRGERKPVLVVEEADSEDAGANERIHYGTFDRFEPYERRDPNDTAWGLSMTEWL